MLGTTFEYFESVLNGSNMHLNASIPFESLEFELECFE